MQIDLQWRFRTDSSAGKIPSIDLDHQQMRLCGGDERQMSLPEDFESSLYLAPCTAKRRFRIKPVFVSVYLEKAEHDNDEIMQIDSDGFARRKDT